MVRKGWFKEAEQEWNLVLLDLTFYTGKLTRESDARNEGMPEGVEDDTMPSEYFGLKILERLHAEYPDLPIVILSNRSRKDIALQINRAGALGFIDVDTDEGAKVLGDMIYNHALIPDTTGRIVGRSRAVAKVLRMARRAARTEQSILIRGESGTGKELIAAYVNEVRQRNSPDRPFACVNSGALTEELYYSQLFGHCKGAFTGAHDRAIGIVERAHGGDVFLDEIANMPERAQQGMLRVLEDGVVAPLGGRESDNRTVQVRFIAATNADLEIMIARGAFREDLYERLIGGGNILVPPLRERLDDLPLLIERFTRKFERDLGAMRRTITAEAIDKCARYTWPRNIRQLRNSLQQAVSSFPDLEYLMPEHLVLPSAPVGKSATAQEPKADRASLSEILETLSRFDFAGLPDQEIHGQLHQFQGSYATFLARYLVASLAKHRRSGGTASVQPALQFMTGDNTLTSADAYDIINRIAALAERASIDLVSSLGNDALLIQALEQSRSRRGRKKGSVRKKTIPTF
jgi:DNA-binding NtrC family response regulator